MPEKKWWASKAIWGSILVTAIGVYETVKLLLKDNFGVILPEIPGSILTILGAFGIYGRKTANTVIK